MVLTDSGYWLALANQNDRWHSRALKITALLEQETLVITWPVITETCHLLLTRLNVLAQTLFLNQIDQCTQLFQLEYRHIPKIQQLMTKYADLPIDLADASLVLAANELHECQILSTDQRDFRAYRWKNYRPFKNLLLPD